MALRLCLTDVRAAFSDICGQKSDICQTSSFSGGTMYPTLGRLKRTGELSFGKPQDYFVLEPDDSAFDATAILVLQR